MEAAEGVRAGPEDHLESGSTVAISGRFRDECRIACRQTLSHDIRVKSASVILQCRVPVEIKQRVLALAAHREVAPSALLRSLVSEFVEHEHGPSVSRSPKLSVALGQVKSDRITFRILPADRQSLRERASARSLPETTYLGMLVRSHIRKTTPIPAPELQALRESVMELRSASRRLESLVRNCASSTKVSEAWTSEAGAQISACEQLRDRVLDYIRANIRSWETGHAETGR